MLIKPLLIPIILIIAFPTSILSQEDINQRLDRIEAKLNYLLELHQSQTTRIDSSDILCDNLNLLWGIQGVLGTILDKNYFIINHHDGWKIPYWVAYYLSTDNLPGDVPRTDNFRTDHQLLAGSRAELGDYRRSGYDRGDMAPAAAFKRSRDAMSATFLLSNMAPQTPKLNRGIWKILEEETRDMVNNKGEAWVFTGNAFMDSDSIFIDPFDSIGPNHIAVPTHCFKAILSRSEVGSFSAFAFLIPNQRIRIPGEPVDYMISVDRLEEITSFDFFPLLSDNIENQIESQISGIWP